MRNPLNYENRRVYQDDSGLFGILRNGELEYPADFETFAEAQAIADAHDFGCETYEDAVAFVAFSKRIK